MNSRTIDPNADAFCRIVAAMLLEQTQTGQAVKSQPMKRKAGVRRQSKRS